MRRGILLLLNHELSIEGKKKRKRKRKKGEEKHGSSKASYRTKLFRAVLLSDRQKFKIGKLGSNLRVKKRNGTEGREKVSFFPRIAR